MDELNPQNSASNERIKTVEDFLLDPERVIFDQLERFERATTNLTNLLSGVDLASLELLQGDEGYTPVRGTDYMNDSDIEAIQDFILENIPQVGTDLPSFDQVSVLVSEEVAKIPRIKGDPGKQGKPGKDGENGSPDTGREIVSKLRSLPKNARLLVSDIRGLQPELNSIKVDFGNRLDTIEARLSEKITLAIPSQGGGMSSVNWGDIGGTLSDQTDLQNALNGKLSNITGLVSAGTDISITGTGTSGDPYVVNATGGSGTPTLDQVLASGDTATDKEAVFENTTDSTVTTLDSFGLNINDGTGNQLDLDAEGLDIRQSSNRARIESDTINSNRTHILPNKSGTFAHLDDISLSTLGITATATEINYLSGVTSSVQTQLNGKQATITGGATTIVSSDLTTNRALVSNASGKVAVSTVTSTELGYLSGVTSAIQTQLDGKVTGPASATDNAIARYDSTTGKLIQNSLVSIDDSGNILMGGTASLDFGGGSAVLTGGTGFMNVSTGDLRVTSAGSNANSVLTRTGDQTVTTKRIQPRVSTTATGNITPALATANIWQRTGLTGTCTIGAPTGTPVLGEILVFMLLDNGTSRTLTWNAAFTTRVMGRALPTATVAGKQLLVTAQYNGATWLCLYEQEI